MVDKVGDEVRNSGMFVDKNGKPLPKDSATKQERYDKWLVLHDKYSESITELFKTTKDVLGEEVFS